MICHSNSPSFRGCGQLLQSQDSPGDAHFHSPVVSDRSAANNYRPTWIVGSLLPFVRFFAVPVTVGPQRRRIIGPPQFLDHRLVAFLDAHSFDDPQSLDIDFPPSRRSVIPQPAVLVAPDDHAKARAIRCRVPPTESVRRDVADVLAYSAVAVASMSEEDGPDLRWFAR
jgi:hypothetical protein